MRDCVLSGRFTREEDAELRALATAIQLPVKEMVRTALMEWRARQFVAEPIEGGTHA